MRLHRDLDVSQKTERFMLHRTRAAMAEGSLLRFIGIVEADEMFVGGLEGNKHSHKRLHAGRGAVGEAIVAGVRERDSGKVSAPVVQSRDAGTIIPFVTSRTSDDAVIHTDEASVYGASHRCTRP